MSIISKEDLLNKQKEVQNTISTYTCRVLVCSGTGCMASINKTFRGNTV